MKFSVLPLLATTAHGVSNIIQIAKATPDLSTLVTAVSAGGLVKTLESPGPFTVFAPTNEAYAALPDGQIIKTVEGSVLKATVNNTGVFINNAQVTTANVDASNGVVHIIDGVLLPTKSNSAAGKTIVDLAVAT